MLAKHFYRFSLFSSFAGRRVFWFLRLSTGKKCKTKKKMHKYTNRLLVIRSSSRLLLLLGRSASFFPQCPSILCESWKPSFHPSTFSLSLLLLAALLTWSIVSYIFRLGERKNEKKKPKSVHHHRISTKRNWILMARTTLATNEMNNTHTHTSFDYYLLLSFLFLSFLISLLAFQCRGVKIPWTSSFHSFVKTSSFPPFFRLLLFFFPLSLLLVSAAGRTNARRGFWIRIPNCFGFWLLRVCAMRTARVWLC